MERMIQRLNWLYYMPRYLIPVATEDRSTPLDQQLYGRSSGPCQHYNFYGYPNLLAHPNHFTSRKPKRHTSPSEGKPVNTSVKSDDILDYYSYASYLYSEREAFTQNTNYNNYPSSSQEPSEDYITRTSDEISHPNEREVNEMHRTIPTSTANEIYSERALSLYNLSNAEAEPRSDYTKMENEVNTVVEKTRKSEVESENGLFPLRVVHDSEHEPRQETTGEFPNAIRRSSVIVVRKPSPPRQREETHVPERNSLSSSSCPQRCSELQNTEEGKIKEGKRRRKTSLQQLEENEDWLKRSKQCHKCRYCTKGFPKQSALVVHERVHTGEKPYMCSQCGRAFSINGNLRRHMFIHTGERPFACRTCGKTFNNPSHVRRHERRLHPSKVTLGTE